MRHISAVVLARPRLTLAAWLAVVVLVAAGGASAGGDLAATSLVVPGGEAERTERLAEQHLGEGSTYVAVLLRGDPAAISERAPLAAAEIRALPRVRADVARPSGRAALIAVRFPVTGDGQRDRVEAQIARIAERTAGDGLQVAVTGPGIAGRALEDEALAAVSRAELLALPALLLVLVLVFRSIVAAAVPLVFGIAAVAAAHGAVAVIASLKDVDAFAVTLASMVGLALGVDYSLLMVSRFREELAAGADAREAARRTALTAGQTVAIAGVVLGAALGVALAFAPGGILLSTVIGALAAELCAAVGALVGLPALLAVLGSRVNAGAIGRAPTGESRWIGRLLAVARRPALTAVVVGGALLALGAPAIGLSTGPPDASQLPEGHPARAGVEQIAQAAGGGWTAPFVIVAADESGRMDPRTIERWRSELTELPGVRAASINANASGSALHVTVVGPAGPNAAATRVLHRQLLRAADDLERRTRWQVAVGGQPAEFTEFRNSLGDRAPLLVVAVAIAGGLALSVVFRSVVLAALAVALNLLAVGAAFGLVTLLFDGASPPLGGPGFVDAVSLIAAFTVVFGLSIDYHVFLIARMREERLGGAAMDAVIDRSLRRTGSVVSGAAAIMAAVFVAFAFADMAAIRQLGTALAIAIVLDATVVRLLLLPSLCRLLGDRLWWAPKPPWRRTRPLRAPDRGGEPAPREAR